MAEIGAVVTLLAALAGCQCADVPRSAPLAQVRSTLPGATSASSLARRVCDLLQRDPAQRRAQCCSTEARHFALECEQALGAALARGALEIDEAVLGECAAASAREQTGCDWVTPSQPLPPAVCRGLTRGLVAKGGDCRSTLECAGSLHCAGGTPSEAGRCAPPEPTGSACDRTNDGLEAYLFASDAEARQPICAGSCSMSTHRCQEAAPAAAHQVSVSPALPGAACRSDLDCPTGGCNVGRCGMKCTLSLASRPPSLPALAFQRRPTRLEPR